MGRNGAAENKLAPGWLQWGNHHFMTIFWAVVGVLCAVFVPYFLIEHDVDELDDRLSMWMSLAGIFTVALYTLGYVFRLAGFMGKKPVWFARVICNCCASVLFIWVSVKQKSSPHAVIPYCFLAGSVFALLEITKPTCDFGVLQFFLRLPAIACYHLHIVKLYVLVAFLLFFCTVWQAYYLHVLPNPESAERSGERRGKVGGRKKKIGPVRLQWGNHHFVTIFWAVVGVICAVFVPYFLIEHDLDDELSMWMSLAGIFTAALYALGYLFRLGGIMRRKVVWYATVIGNYCASGLVIWVSSASHKSSSNAAIAYILLAVAVFGLSEIAKPKCDFGLLQYFLRLPFQTAITCYGLPVVGWYFLDAFLLIFCTIWQAYFLHVVPDPTSSPSTPPQTAEKPSLQQSEKPPKAEEVGSFYVAEKEN